jgi:hypothetical protein
LKKWRIYMSNDHDHPYDHEYRNWAEKAKANGGEEAGSLLEEGARPGWY